MDNSLRIIVITGPTASGKTALAVKLADFFNGEIVSVDSRQVYRHMDIGSGKDISEYNINADKTIPYHLIDVCDPNEEYHLQRFCRDIWQIVPTIVQRNHLPIICGGTPLYLNAFLRNYSLPGGKPDEQRRSELDNLGLDGLTSLLQKLDSHAYEAIEDKQNPMRLRRAIEIIENKSQNNFVPPNIKLDALIIGSFRHRSELHKRIEKRLDERLNHGMIDEIKELHQHYMVPFERLEAFGLEYRYISYFLQNKMDFATMRDQLLFQIRQFAKRQDIWFRKMEREGMIIHWMDPDDIYQAQNLIDRFLNNIPLPPPSIQLKNTYYGKKTS